MDKYITVYWQLSELAQGDVGVVPCTNTGGICIQAKQLYVHGLQLIRETVLRDNDAQLFHQRLKKKKKNCMYTLHGPLDTEQAKYCSLGNLTVKMQGNDQNCSKYS